MIPVEVPRTYNISNFSPEPLPSTLDLTVTRSERRVNSIVQSKGTIRSGVSSGFLNPAPSHEDQFRSGDQVNPRNAK
jgi:hypothetical protein